MNCRTGRIAWVLLIGIAFAADRANGAPILLLHMDHVIESPIQRWPEGVPSSLDYLFSITKETGGLSDVGLVWHLPVTAADVGHTFVASAAQVADLNSATNGITITVGAQIQNVFSAVAGELQNAASNSPLHQGVTTLSVALNVPSLAGYQVTSITRTVDSFSIQPFQQGPDVGYFYSGSQTLDVYGEAVPEPATLGLVAGLVMVGWVGRRSRRPAQVE